MDNADALKKDRSLCKSRFTRLNTSIANSIQTFNKALLETKLADLRTIWLELQNKHDEHLFAVNGEQEDANDDDWIATCMLMFEATENRIYEAMNRVSENVLAEEENKAKQSEEKVKEEKRTELSNKCKSLLIEIDTKEGKFKQARTDLLDLLDCGNDKEHVVLAVKGAITHLESCKIEVEESRNELIRTKIQCNETVPEQMRDAIINAEKLYNEAAGKANVFCSKHSNAPGVGKVEQPKGGVGIRRPKTNFEIFDGNLRKYPSFKNDFLKRIKPLYTGEEEAFILRTYLASEIKEDVLTAGDDATEIWERLDRKYGDEGKLVESIMKDVKQIKKCDEKNPKETIEMISTLERAHRDLRYLSMEQEISNSTIVSLIEQKLPKNIEDDWLKIVTGENRISIGRDKFPELLKLLLSHKERLEYKFSELRFSDNVIEEDIYHIDGGAHRGAGCWIHTGLHHPIWKCRTFESKPIEEKLELICNRNACTICLDVRHTKDACTKGFKCRVQGGAPHHSLIHEAYVKGLTFHTMESHISNGTRGGTLLLLQTITCVTPQAKREHKISCLWDNGSTLSFITFSTAKKMNLRGKQVYLKVTKVGGSVENILSHEYILPVKDNDGNELLIKVYGLDRISSDIQAVSLRNVISVFPRINTSHLNRPTSGQVEVLLGMDVAGYHPVQEKAAGHLILYRGRFGFVIGGSHPSIQERTQKLVQHAEVNFTEALFEDIESLGVECTPKCGGCRCGNCHPGKQNMTLLEEREYSMIKASLQHDKGKSRWKTEIPCRTNLSELHNNKTQVLGCLYSQEKRLKKNEEHAKLYQSQIEDMVRRKACRPLSEQEYKSYPGPKYFIAHHEVIKPESKSTPCRIVFNSSQKFKGKCLNDCYVKGPSMLNNLLGVLLRFSEEKVAIMCDLAKMYHSIDISLKDQMTHIFLW